MAHSVRPKVLLFDLGGVLVDNVAFDRLPELLPEPIERGALVDRRIDSPSVRRGTWRLPAKPGCWLFTRSVSRP